MNRKEYNKLNKLWESKVRNSLKCKLENKFIKWFSTWPMYLKWWFSDFLYWFLVIFISRVFKIHTGNFNYLMINLECEAHKDELVLSPYVDNLLCKLIRFDEDDDDYYWVVQDLKRGEVWHSACSGFTPIKSCIFGRYYYRADYKVALAEFDKRWNDSKTQLAIKRYKEKQYKLMKKVWKKEWPE